MSLNSVQSRSKYHVAFADLHQGTGRHAHDCQPVPTTKMRQRQKYSILALVFIAFLSWVRLDHELAHLQPNSFDLKDWQVAHGTARRATIVSINPPATIRTFRFN